MGECWCSAAYPAIPYVWRFPAAAELYDPRTGRWSETAADVGGRQGHSATLLRDGRVLVVGGMGEVGPEPTARIYDPAHDSWSAAWLPAIVRSGHTATLLPDGKVLVLGGVGAPAVEVAQGPMTMGLSRYPLETCTTLSSTCGSPPWR
jgi:hypothetical protein